MPSLHEILQNRREVVLETFARRVRDRQLAPAGTAPSQILDDLPEFLDEVTAALRRAAQIDRVSHHEERPARAHGEQRFALRFDLRDVIVEYGVLRDCIVDIAREEGVHPNVDELQCLAKCIEVGIEQAVLEFTARRDSAQAATLKETQLAVRTREHVLAIVAHDLKNPLNSIRMTAARLRSEELPPEEAERMGVFIERSVQRMDRLITDLLVLAQLEAGHLRIERAEVDLRVLARGALEHVRPLAEAKKVSLELIEVSDNAIMVDCDAARIGQVFDNLLGNAVKFTPDAGAIRVRVSRDVRESVVEVENTGEGIPLEDQAHIFERFWQSSDGAPRGQGLGLAIAHGIIEAHHGTLSVSSAPGKGAILRFALPLATPSSSNRWAVAKVGGEAAEAPRVKRPA